MLQTVLQRDHAPDLAGQPGQMGPRRSPGWREALPQDMQEDIRDAARHKILSMPALSATGGMSVGNGGWGGGPGEMPQNFPAEGEQMYGSGPPAAIDKGA